MPLKPKSNTQRRSAVNAPVRDDSHRINKRGNGRLTPKVYQTARLIPIMTRSKTKVEADITADQPTVRVFIKTASSLGTITIELPLSATGRQLKVLVENRMGIPPDVQRLAFAGHMLQDRKTIAEASDDSSLRMTRLQTLTLCNSKGLTRRRLCRWFCV